MPFHDEQSYPANRAGVPEVYQGFSGVTARAHDTPGIMFFETIDASGNKEVKYVWLDGNGNFRTSTSIPTDQDADGIGLGGSQIKEIAITADFDNSEQTGLWDIPDPSVILGVWLKVTTADTSQTLDVGTDGAGSNDPNGFLAAVSVNATGLIKGTLASGGQTLGALLYVDESGAGVLVPEAACINGVAELTYTGSDTTNTVRGSIFVQYIDLT